MYAPDNRPDRTETFELQGVPTEPNLIPVETKAGAYTRPLLQLNLSRFGHPSPCPPVQ